MHCVENEVLIPTIFKLILQLYGYYFIPTQTFNHKYVNWRCVATFIYQLSPPYRTLDRKNYIYKLHNTTRYIMDRLKTTYQVYLCSNGSEVSKQQHVVKHRQLFCGQKPKRNHHFQYATLPHGLPDDLIHSY